MAVVVGNDDCKTVREDEGQKIWVLFYFFLFSSFIVKFSPLVLKNKKFMSMCCFIIG